MSDRLIELMKEVKFPPFKDGGGLDISVKYQLPEHAFEAIAAHLRENGVIVPPCKVGDEVFFNFAELNETCPAKVVAIYLNYYTPSMPLWITIRYDSNLIGRHEVKISADVFRLVCHYTQEEAEKALAERSGK